VLLAPAPRRIPVERVHAPIGAVDRALPIRITLSNPSTRRVKLLVRDAVAPSLRPAVRAQRAVLGKDGGSVGSVGYQIRPARRGRFVLGPVTIRAYGPLGLAGRQRSVGLSTVLKVYPALLGRRQIEGRLRRSRVLETGTRSARVRGGGLEFDSLREYHPDDEFRRINWRATARSGKPITTIHREERNQNVVLLLDAGRTMAATVAGAPRFEHALDAAVALATLAVDVGDRVGAFAFADRILARVPPRSDAWQPGRIVDALFAVEPELSAADYLGTVARVLGRFQRRAMVVLFTDLSDDAALGSLVATIPSMTRRHLVAVVQVLDPEVARLAAVVPVSSEDAFQKAAAAATESRRARAAARLAQHGALVVDQPPTNVVSALADEYLRAKAFRRL
jgi:uncharacterized protein (DUF58 family)